MNEWKGKPRPPHLPSPGACWHDAKSDSALACLSRLPGPLCWLLCIQAIQATVTSSLQYLRTGGRQGEVTWVLYPVRFMPLALRRGHNNPTLQGSLTCDRCPLPGLSTALSGQGVPVRLKQAPLVAVLIGLPAQGLSCMH